MKIAVLLPDLRPGGVERMRLNMAPVWLKYGHQVELVLRVRHGALLEHVPEGVTVHSLNAPRTRNAFLPLAKYLHSKKPDVFLAAMWPLTFVAPLAARAVRYKGRVVVSEHDNMSAEYAGWGGLHRLLMRVSMRVGYLLADAVVGVSEGVLDDLVGLSGLPRDKFHLIYNPACVGRDASASTMPSELIGRQRIVLSVGTLKRQKRHDVLLHAFARLPGKLGASLCIVGDGELRSDLESLSRSLGIRDRVIFAGYRASTAEWYAHSDLFVLSSDYEGFGNVIVEALEQGTPIVSTDCPSGPREILEDGKYGALVPVGDVEALAKAMEDALSREHDREALKRRAQDFSVDKAADVYLDLLIPGWRDGSRV